MTSSGRRRSAWASSGRCRTPSSTPNAGDSPGPGCSRSGARNRDAGAGSTASPRPAGAPSSAGGPGPRASSTSRATAGSSRRFCWRAEPTSELYELRDAGLLKLFFGADPRKLAEPQLAEHRAKLRDYERQLEECRLLKAPTGVMLALEAGIGHEREYVRFWSRLRR